MFVCDRVDKYTFSHYEAEYRVTHVEQKAMCLNQPELIRYGNGNPLYGWHITDLRILPRPQDLSIYSGRKRVLKGEKVEIEKPCIFGSGNRLKWKPVPLTRPPQSWQYLY